MIHAVTFLTVFIIDHGVAETVYMAAGLPGGGVHKDGGINTHDIVLSWVMLFHQ